MRVTFLKLLRVAAGFTQRQVASRLKIDQALVCRYEKNARRAPKRVKKQIIALCAPRVSWKALVRKATEEDI